MNQITYYLKWFLSIAGITWLLTIICLILGYKEMCKVFILPSIFSLTIKIWLSFDLMVYEVNKIRFENIYNFLNTPIDEF